MASSHPGPSLLAWWGLDGINSTGPEVLTNAWAEWILGHDGCFAHVRPVDGDLVQLVLAQKPGTSLETFTDCGLKA